MILANDWMDWLPPWIRPCSLASTDLDSIPLNDGPNTESPKPNTKNPMMKSGTDAANVDVAMNAYPMSSAPIPSIAICLSLSFFKSWGMMKACEMMSWKPMMENTSPMSAGFQLNVSMVNWDMMACNEPLGTHSRNAAISRRFKFLMDSMLKSCKNGFSRAGVIFSSLFFAWRLSGMKKNP